MYMVVQTEPEDEHRQNTWTTRA